MADSPPPAPAPVPAPAPAPAAPPRDADALSAGALLNAVIDLVRRYPVPLLVPLVVYGILSSGTGGRGDRFFGDFDVSGGDVPWELLPFLAFLGLAAIVMMVVLFLVFALTWLVTTRAALDVLEEDRAPDVMRAFEQVKPVYGKGALTALLYGVLVFLGFLALIVPGVIVAVAWTPWAALVVTGTATGWDALKRASALTRGHRMDLFLLLLLAIGLEIVAAVVFGWLPIVGDVLVGTAHGIVLAGLAVLGAVFYARRTRGGAPADAPVEDAPQV